MPPPEPDRRHHERRDFAAAHRLPGIAAMAGLVGVLGTGAAWALLHLVRVATNLFFLASCVAAGLAAGALSWAVSWAASWAASTSLYKVEDLFACLPLHWMWWPALGNALRSHFGATQRHRTFPVLVGGRFIGMADRDALVAGLQQPGVARVADLFGANVPPMALPDENCRSVATRLAVHGLERLPVVTDAQSRRLVGRVARSDLIKPSLAIGAEEHVRERTLALPLGRARARFRGLTDGPVTGADHPDG